MFRVSVIVPSFNEAAVLPALLKALQAQIRPPDEVIVSDAGSTDGTVDLARAAGATVISGGRNGPGPGRNAGARAATGDILVFMDADVLPRPNFLADALEEFTRKGYAVAACPIEALSNKLTDQLLVEITNLYFLVVDPFQPHAPGYCIFARREIHEAIGGFDEAVKMAEDHDYVQRAAQHGAFGLLTSVRILVSMRRLEKEGFTQLAVKYLWCEMHALAGKPVYTMPFDYEFGAFTPSAAPSSARRRIDIVQLRKQLGRFENPLQRLSDVSLTRLENLIHGDWMDSTRERFRLVLAPPDRELLRRYLRRRLGLFRKEGRPPRQRPLLDRKHPRARPQDGEPQDQ